MASVTDSTTIYIHDFRVGDWWARPALNRLERGEETIQLEPKIMQVLVQLADSAGEVVTREALFGSVWDGAFVSEDVLTRSVVELRKTFGDDSRNPRIIETIPKKGYRLIVNGGEYQDFPHLHFHLISEE